jgi:hypothetical protein
VKFLSIVSSEGVVLIVCPDSAGGGSLSPSF